MTFVKHHLPFADCQDDPHIPLDKRHDNGIITGLWHTGELYIRLKEVGGASLTRHAVSVAGAPCRLMRHCTRS